MDTTIQYKPKSEKTRLEKFQHGLKMVFLGYILDDTVDPIEKQLLRKIDIRLMPFSIICYWLKNMDVQAFTDALNNGVSTQFGFYGNQWAYLGSTYSAGYAIWQVPGTALIARLRPSRILPAFEFVWSVLTLVPMCFTQPWHWYVFRFFLGCAASITYPGILYMLGSWYTKRELGKRTAAFIALSALGQFIQSSLEKPIYFRYGYWPGWAFGGLSIWQWYLVIPALISFAMAMIGLFTLPDYPSNTKWLTEDEKQQAIDRLEREGRTTVVTTFSFRMVRTLFGRLDFWLLVAMFTCIEIFFMGWGVTTLGYFNPGNAIITLVPMYVIQPLTYIVPMLGCTLSDLFQNRHWFVVIPHVLGLISAVLFLAVVPNTQNALTFVYMQLPQELGANARLGAPIVMTWANEVMGHDNQARAFTISTMNTVKTFIGIAPNVITTGPYAPRYLAAYGCVTMLWVFEIIFSFILDWNQKRKAKIAATYLADVVDTKDSKEGGEKEVV